jgi:hypothetical protein
MKVTRLQEKLNSYHESSKKDFGENSEYLKAVCKIAGNRGLSHKERVKRINNWANYLKDSLNNSEKKYIDQILRINTNYVKTTSRAREIKNSHEVRGSIYTIRRDLRGNNLENNIEKNTRISLTERAIEKITNTALPSGTPRILEYSRPEHNKSVPYLRNTGMVLLKGLVAASIAATMTVSGWVGGHLDNENQQSKILGQQPRIEIYENGKTEYENIIKNKDKEIAEQKKAIALAGRPDEEVRKENRENTTEQLKTNYEKNIERVNKEAEKQVRRLLEQKKDLERRLIAAGRPDEEVRKEARKGMVEGERFDNLYSQFQKTSESYEGLKRENNVLSKKNEKLKGIVENYKDFVFNPTVKPLPDKEETLSNRVVESRIEILEVEGPPKPVEIKPQYLKDKFWTYADGFGKENNKNFRKGPLEFILGVGGIAYQGVIVANKTAEAILTPPAEVIGGVGGVLSNVTGINKDTDYKTGAEDGKTFVKRVGANSWGGRSITDADGNLIGAAGALLTLNLKEAGEKLGRGLAIPTESEKGWFNKLTAESVYVFNHIIPFIDWNKGHGHHHNGSSTNFGGGRINEGPGGNSIINESGISGGGIGNFGGVGGR